MGAPELPRWLRVAAKLATAQAKVYAIRAMWYVVWDMSAVVTASLMWFVYMQ